MKFMKLGSKPDAFQHNGNDIRSAGSELPTDIVVHVFDVRFHLHKFPLTSNSKLLQKLILEASQENANEIRIDDIPGGPKAFEICAKFCYGMMVTLNAYNVTAARCAAEYLQMTEDMDRGNLIYKIDVFLNSSVFGSWKDSIIVLQSTKFLLPWAEDLKIVGRSIDTIASKTSVDPSSVKWSYTYSKGSAFNDQIIEVETKLNQKIPTSVPKDWWIEDISELDIDHYKRVMVAVKAKGRMSADLIGEALRTYAIRWLSLSIEELASDDYAQRNKSLVETIIWLLPSDKRSGCSCTFLLKLLKVVNLIGVENSLKDELVDRISSQLDKAIVKDLLIPSRSSGDTMYDVGLVQEIVKRFMLQAYSDSLDNGSNTRGEFVLGSSSLLAVGKLIDGYLAEIACDPDLPLSNFIDLSTPLPLAARPIHDDLYTAIDIYLQNHPDLAKAENKRICSLMDVKKLTPGACAHVAQNERLPLRVVVRVLYFEQQKAATRGLTTQVNKISLDSGQPTTSTTEADWEEVDFKRCGSMRSKPNSIEPTEDECEDKDKKIGRSKGGGLSLASRSRRIFDKIFVGKTQVRNHRSSETSGSSLSPPSTSLNRGEAKSIGSSSRQRRYSLS